jgi:uncharacterized integral membrane protein
MRARVILLVIAILLIAGFAALNWSEVVRPAPLLFGPVVMDAPLGLILLGLLAAAIVVFALSAGALRTRSLLDARHHYKELEAQRVLADNAEASRFTDLRAYLDTSLRELRERDAMQVTELQREMRAHAETTQRMLSARLNELEHRLETRFERMGWGGTGATPPVLSEQVPPQVRERPVAEADARAAQLRDEERLRDERIREERELRREEKATAAERPAESGWRRWF